MDEEMAVLDFFAKTENLPLGLLVAEQIDDIREQMNSRFWKALQQRFNSTLNDSEWQAQVTEDRNATDVLVGLQFKLRDAQPICLFPMLEQQYLGGVWRIFFGLMWQVAPTSEQLALPAVATLKNLLLDMGLKNNDNFLAWQWTKFHPRRSDFLLRFAQQSETLLADFEEILKPLLSDHRALIASANAALKDMPPSRNISLEQLYRKSVLPKMHE
ncbi:MAG: hypothetical protein NTY60_04845 [Proteobacteria bacterium]|nr:hypothetical protein [Pseudomonadota bacterium]